MLHQRQLLVSLIALFTLLLAACTPVMAVPTPAANASPLPAPAQTSIQTPTQESTTAQPEAVRQAQARLAQELGVTVQEIQIQDAKQVQWPDACLGLTHADEMCAAVITPGWQLTATVNGQAYDVHTDKNGTNVRWVQIGAGATPTPRS